MKLDSYLTKRPSARPSDDRARESGVLYLTSIDAQFDSARDIALGPHCFIGAEQTFPDWPNLTFAEPFEDEAALEKGEKHLRGLINHLLPGIVDKLNAYHGTSYSIDFWRIIVLPWLIELSQNSWIRFLRLEKILGQYGDRALTVGVYKGDKKWHIKDTIHFLDTMLKDYHFSWWIESEILTAMAPENWQLIQTEPTFHPKVEAATEPPRIQTSSRIRGLLRNIKYWLGYTDIMGVRLSGLLLSIYVKFLPKSPSRMKFQPDLEFNPDMHFTRPFQDVLGRLIDATMPESFLDDFKPLADKARRLSYRPGRLRLGTLSFWNEQEKVIAAFSQKAGEKRVISQHGGEYGMLNYNIMFNEMEGRLSTLITWGWAYDEPADINGHFLPLPSPFHSKIANRHKRKNDSIIVVGGGIRILFNRLHWWSRMEMPVRYYKDTISFLETLGDAVRKNVVFRLYARSSSDIDTRKIISDHFPGTPMLEGDFHSALMKCRLVVFYSFGTAMNHTMAANTPTVVYMPPDLMKPRKEAEPYFEPLRRCGVIHDSPEAAARHIKDIWDDVEGWWLSDEVQAARKAWVHQFARTDRFWWWHWIKALAKLKDVG